jgi:hypothetical protein
MSAKKRKKKLTNMLITHGNKVFEFLDHNEFQIPVELKTQAVTSAPSVRYHGPKIPLKDWQQVLSFFASVFKADRSECQVRLYRHKTTGLFKFWAFPQSKNSGMTTRELPSSELWAATDAMFDDNWVHFGSVHHHCSMGAFQSGVDKNDEVNAAVNGLHITVGTLDKSTYDIHARAVVNIAGELNPDMTLKRAGSTETGSVVLSDWFDCVDLTHIPCKFHEDIVKDMITTPSDIPFPIEWSNNLVQEVARFQQPGNLFSSSILDWPKVQGVKSWPRGITVPRDRGVQMTEDEQWNAYFNLQ